MTTNNVRRMLRAVAVMALATVAIPASAQMPERLSPPPTIESDNFLFNLGLTAGYRSAQITDQDNLASEFAKNRYYEAANFRDGINISAFNIYGERKAGQPGFFDEASITANGLMDPFTNANLRVRAFHKYDLKVDFRQAKYFMDRLNTTAAKSMIYSGLHDFDFKRQFLNASLGIEATEDLSFALKFNQTSRNGNETNTFSPSFLGSDEGLVGGYARGNFFWVNLPVNDATNEFSAEVKYKLAPTTSFTLGGGLRSYDRDFSPSRLSDTSLNFIVNSTTGFDRIGIVGTNKNYEPLASYNYTETRKASTPIMFFELVSRPMDALSLTANVRYEKLTEDITTNMPEATGTLGAKKTAFYSSMEGTGKIDQTTLVGALALDARLMEGLSLGGQYRYTNFDSKSTGEYATAWDTAGTLALVKAINHQLTDSKAETEYKIPQHYIQGFVDYRPLTELSMRAGIILNMRQPDVDRIDDAEGKVTHDSAFNVNLSKHTTATTPYFTFNARPVPELRLNGRFSVTSTKATFNGDVAQTPADLAGAEADIPIRIDPKSKTDFSFGADYQVVEELGLGARYIVSNGKSDFISMKPGGGPAHASQTITNATYTNDLTRMQGSITYNFMKNSTLVFSYENSKSDMTIPTTWTRGIGNISRPYGDSMTIAIDQHIKDNYFDASVNTRPLEALGVVLGLSYLKSEGGPSVTQDVVANPTQGGAPYAQDITRFGGPYSWMQFHGQVTYDVTQNIGLQFDFQLYSLKEEVVDNFIATNNFKANLYKGGIVVRL